MDADDGVGQERGDAENLGRDAGDLGLRGGVGGDQLLDAGLFQPLDGDGAEDGVGDAE